MLLALTYLSKDKYHIGKENSNLSSFFDDERKWESSVLNVVWILKNVISLFGRSFIRRSQSDGNILGESDSTTRNMHAPDCPYSSENPDKQSLLEPLLKSTCGTSICQCRYA